MNEMRIMFSRTRKDLLPIFKKAGAVVKEGADVGGDVRVAWDTTNEAECRAVGKMFDELTTAGFRAIKVGDDGKGKDGEPIKKFDKEIGRMVMISPMQGGA